MQLVPYKGRIILCYSCIKIYYICKHQEGGFVGNVISVNRINGVANNFFVFR